MRKGHEGQKPGFQHHSSAQCCQWATLSRILFFFPLEVFLLACISCTGEIHCDISEYAYIVHWLGPLPPSLSLIVLFHIRIYSTSTISTLLYCFLTPSLGRILARVKHLLQGVWISLACHLQTVESLHGSNGS
jgi:hypothetical protein